MSNSNVIDEINVLKELFSKLVDVLTKLNESIEEIKETPKEVATDMETRLKNLEEKVDKILTLLHEKGAPIVSEAVPAKEELIPSPEETTPETITTVTEEPSPSKVAEQAVTPEIQPSVHKETETELKEEISLPPMSEISVPEEPFSESVETKPPTPIDVEAVKNQINQLKENLVELERQISDLEFNYEGGFIEFTEYQSRITDLKSRREKLVKEIRELEQKISG